MKTLNIQTRHPYPIFIGNHLFSEIAKYGSSLKKRIAIIADDNLYSYAKDLQSEFKKLDISAELFFFPPGEKYKTREMKQVLEDQLLSQQFGRDSCLIALGGGVVTDLVGFLAATFCRGVPCIYVPTTLLAMVDASIGGKTGVNTVSGKNLIGTFTQPSSVFIDIHTLSTLADSEFNQGMVEVIKHGLIADAKLFSQIQDQIDLIQNKNPEILIDIIYRSCQIKKTIVETDEFETTGQRQLLNFGHTIGHAVESFENYNIKHGEAVAIGLLTECFLALQSGFLTEPFLQDLKSLFLNYHLPLKTNAFNHEDNLQSFLSQDKKSIAKVPHFVLLKEPGIPYVKTNQYTHAIDYDLLDKTLHWAGAQFAC